MNIATALAKEHSKIQHDKIVAYIGADAKRFAELVKLFMNGPYRITQRASWPLSTCVENHPTLIAPHLKKILNYLKQDDIHDAVKRNTLRLLQYAHVPASLQGLVIDLCFKYISDAKEPVAIRAFSITVLTNLAKTIHELKNELIPVIEQRLPYEKPAFVSRGSKALNVLKRH